MHYSNERRREWGWGPVHLVVSTGARLVQRHLLHTFRNIRACLLSVYYPLPRRGDNALLQGPIMRQDMIEVSQSQRHLIFKLEQNCLCCTFIFKSDQVNFICTALSAKRSDKVLHTATKGIRRQAFTLKHKTLHTAWYNLEQYDIEDPFKGGSMCLKRPDLAEIKPQLTCIQIRIHNAGRPVSSYPV